MNKTVFFLLTLSFFSAGVFAEAQTLDLPPRDERPEYPLSDKREENGENFSVQDPVSSEVRTNEETDVPAEPAAVVIDNPEELSGNNSDGEKIELAGVSDIPAAKRPRTPDAEKVRKASEKDEKDSDQKTRDTIEYGIETELKELVQKLIDNDDPRYSDRLYDLFQKTKSPSVREKILEYFQKQEDPCLEDYAVSILNDPYEEKNSTVEQCFKYIAAVKTREAVPAVVTLLESENEAYFNPALTTLGEIGGRKEAKYLVEFLDRPDLTAAQRQSLMRVLGKLKAVETWDSLVEIAQDDGENSFVRMYAAEAIGAMEKKESIPVLVKLFETNDSKLRCYVIKGLAYFPDDKDAKNVVVQAIKDGQYKVRLDAMDAALKMKTADSIPYIFYRAKNDPEASVKTKAYEVLAKFDSAEADKFLVSLIADKKSSDNVRRQSAEALLKYGKAGRSEIASLAEETVADDRKKPFRYTIGKLIAKYPDEAFAGVCKSFIASEDAATVGIGLDMYNSGKYGGAEAQIRIVADDKKNGPNKKRAMKILGIEEEQEDAKAPEEKASDKAESPVSSDNER